MLDKKYVVTVSNKELFESNSSTDAAAIMRICDVLAFDAAVQHELATINDLYENNEQDASDARLDAFNVQLKFQDRVLTVDLSCMDTYDAFVKFLVAYEAELDLYR